MSLRSCKKKINNIDGLKPYPHIFNKKSYKQVCTYCGIPAREKIKDKPCPIHTRLKASSII